MSKKYKIPCSWQMYGFVEVEAEDWSDAVWQAQQDGRSLPEDGEYVMSSFEVDHDMIEFEREEERKEIRRKVDAGFPTGNDADFGTSME